MRQRITFDIEWAPFTPDKTMNLYYQAARVAITSMGIGHDPPFDHFRALVESSDTRTTKE